MQINNTLDVDGTLDIKTNGASRIKLTPSGVNTSTVDVLGNLRLYNNATNNINLKGSDGSGTFSSTVTCGGFILGNTTITRNGPDARTFTIPNVANTEFVMKGGNQDITGTVSDISNHDTDDLEVGTTNKYFTNTLARGAFSGSTGVSISTAGAISIGQAVSTTSSVTFTGVTATTFTGQVTDISNHDTDDLSEGTSKYFTNARARGAISASTGVSISNGAISIGQAVSTTDSVTFTGVTATTFTGQVTDISNHDTDDLEVGTTNKYFTTTLARGAFSASTGVSISSGAISIGQAVATTSSVTFAGVTADLTGDVTGDVTGNADTATSAAACSGNSATASTADACSGNSATASTASGLSTTAACNSGFMSVDGTATRYVYDYSRIVGYPRSFNSYSHDDSGAATKNVCAEFHQAILIKGHVFIQSDMRVKAEITTLDQKHSLDMIGKLRPVSYKRMIDGNFVLGYIGQELQDIIPPAVNCDGIEPIGNIDIYGVVTKIKSITDSNGHECVSMVIELEKPLQEEIKNKKDVLFGVGIQLMSGTNRNLFYNPDLCDDPTDMSIELLDYTKNEQLDEDTRFRIFGEIVTDAQSVDYNEVFVVVSSAVKELNDIRKEDRSRIETLENQVSQLLARVEALESK